MMHGQKNIKMVMCQKQELNSGVCVTLKNLLLGRDVFYYNGTTGV